MSHRYQKKNEKLEKSNQGIPIDHAYSKKPHGYFKKNQISKIRLNGEVIDLKRIKTGFKRVIVLDNLFDKFELTVVGDTVDLDIISGIPGEQCECCLGSGKSLTIPGSLCECCGGTGRKKAKKENK